jgi:predicted transcriptional regulator
MSPSRDRRVLERTRIERDSNGEILRFDEQKINLKHEEREDFFLLFSNNIGRLSSINGTAQKVLSIILTSKVTWSNEVLLDNVTRNEIATALNSSVQTIKNAVTNLVKHEVLLMKKVTGGYKYALNPYLFGRGKWNEIEKVRHNITMEYDFINQEFKQTVDTISQYEGLPAKEDIEVVGAKETRSKDGRFVEQEVTIKTRSGRTKFMNALKGELGDIETIQNERYDG